MKLVIVDYGQIVTVFLFFSYNRVDKDGSKDSESRKASKLHGVSRVKTFLWKELLGQ